MPRLLTRFAHALPLLLIGVFSAVAQQTTLDSLEQSLAKAKVEERRIDIMLDLCWLLRRQDNPQAQVYGEDARHAALIIGDSTRFHLANTNLAVVFSYQNKFAEATQITMAAWYFFNRSQQPQYAAKAALVQASVKTLKGEFASADSILTTAIPIFQEISDTIGWVDCLRTKAYNFYRQRQYIRSCRHFYKAKALCEAIGEKERLPLILNTLGVIMKRLHQPAEALSYYTQALAMTGDQLNRSELLNNISNLYQELGDWDNALQYQEQALDLKKNLGVPRAIAFSLHNLGVIQKNRHNYGLALSLFEQSLAIKDTLQKGNLERSKTINNIGNIHKELKQHNQAIAYYQIFLQLAATEKDTVELCRGHHNLADVYTRTAQSELALKHAEQCLTLARGINDFQFMQKGHQHLARLYAARNAFEDSYKHQRTANALNDSLLNIDKLRGVVAVEHQQALAALRQEQQMGSQPEQELPKSSLKQGMVLIIIAVLGTCVALLFWYRRRRPLLELEAKMDALLRMYQPPEGNTTASSTAIADMGSFLQTKLQEEADWQVFEQYFTKIHSNFYRNLKLRYPSITSNELRHCALLKLNLQNKEIAQILHVSPDSVRKAQQRLGQKLALTKPSSLRDFITMF